MVINEKLTSARQNRLSCTMIPKTMSQSDSDPWMMTNGKE